MGEISILICRAAETSGFDIPETTLRLFLFLDLLIWQRLGDCELKKLLLEIGGCNDFLSVFTGNCAKMKMALVVVLVREV